MGRRDNKRAGLRKTVSWPANAGHPVATNIVADRGTPCNFIRLSLDHLGGPHLRAMTMVFRASNVLGHSIMKRYYVLVCLLIASSAFAQQAEKTIVYTHANLF